MTRRTMTTLAVTLLCILAMTGLVWAMSSTNYALDWFTPLTGTGGSASSTNYAVNFTVGQSAIGAPSSTNYGACLGYWCGVAAGEYSIYLPLVLRNY
ncbi:MAG: hypothetical protein H5T62_04930 [Anaerolineae bacterium]|nr:hypothetical protein [Anaerolineae bacterium]